jgi:LytS/YehU family sensor histidine kinase
MISPLLILPLIENCYKHGVSNDTENSWIRIDLSIQADWLTVKVENSKSASLKTETNGKNGIGLENVRKRLEILYPARHEFKSMCEEHSYLTILKIKNLVVEDTVPHSG